MKKFLIYLALFLSLAVSISAIPSPRDIYTETKYYEAMYRDFPVGICFVNEEGRYIAANTIFCNFVGRSEEELKRLTFDAITARQDVDLQIDANRKIVNCEDKSYTMFKQYIHKRGDSIWARITAMGIYDSMGKFSHYIVVVEPMSTSTFFEADINKKLEEIKNNLSNIQKSGVTENGVGTFIVNNWGTLIPWLLAVVITIGGILFRIQTDSRKIQDLEQSIKAKNDRAN